MGILEEQGSETHIRILPFICKVDQSEPNIKNGEEIVIWKNDQKTRFFLVQKINPIEEYELI